MIIRLKQNLNSVSVFVLITVTLIHYVFTQPLYHEQDVTTLSQFFKQSKAGLNSEFSFSKTGCRTKVKKFSLQ